MELSLIGKTITTPSVQGLGLPVQPRGAVAPARVCCKSRTIRRNRRRTRRRLFSGDDYEDGAEDPLYYYVELGSAENFWYYVDPAGGGPSDRGRFGFNGGKGGGGGWSSDGFGGQSSEDPSRPPPPERSSGFATNSLPEFIWWVALSNSLQFVLRMIMTMAAEAIGKAKLPIGL